MGKEELVDLPAPGGVFPGDDLFDDQLEGERSIADPSVEVVRVVCVRAGNNDSGLVGEKIELEEIRVRRWYYGETNQCAMRLVTVRSDVGQNAVLGDGGFFGDVRIDGRRSKELLEAGERESRQQHTEAPHG